MAEEKEQKEKEAETPEVVEEEKINLDAEKTEFAEKEVEKEPGETVKKDDKRDKLDIEAWNPKTSLGQKVKSGEIVIVSNK